MAMNNSATVVRPQLWCSVDDPGNFCDAIWYDPGIMKFVPLCHMEKHFMVRNEKDELIKSKLVVGDMPAVLGFRRNETFIAEQWLYEDTFNWGNHSQKVDAYGQKGSRSVMYVALRLLFCLGVRRVFLLGCDFKMEVGKQNYAFDQDRSPSSVRGNNSSYRIMNVRFSKLLPYFEAEGFHVFNCTPNSGLDVFPHVSYADALDAVEAVIPQRIDTSGMYDRKAKQKQKKQDDAKQAKRAKQPEPARSDAAQPPSAASRVERNGQKVKGSPEGDVTLMRFDLFEPEHEHWNITCPRLGKHDRHAPRLYYPSTFSREHCIELALSNLEHHHHIAMSLAGVGPRKLTLPIDWIREQLQSERDRGTRMRISVPPEGTAAHEQQSSAASVATVLVLCGGEAKRWNNHLGVPKQLIEIDGEPLVHRTCRLIRRYAGADCDVRIVIREGHRNCPWKLDALRSQYGVEPYFFVPDEGHKGAGKFLSSRPIWSGNVLFVLGDVYFTDAAIAKSVTPEHDWQVVGRGRGSRITGKRWGECFSFFFPQQMLYEVDLTLQKLLRMSRRRKKSLKRIGGWELYRSLVGIPPTKRRITSNFVHVNDFTEDFDFPGDYSNWIKRYTAHVQVRSEYADGA